MDQLLFTEVCSEMAYLDFLGSGSLASLLPPCYLYSALLDLARVSHSVALIQDGSSPACVVGDQVGQALSGPCGGHGHSQLFS